jgi:hypothetical protein
MEPYLLCESREKYQSRERVLERLLHCIWSEQLFRKTLQLDGKLLAISSPGWWNLEAGPDFRNAEIFVDGKRACGDVEIHLSSGDWYQHRHHLDPRYNQVVLHVVLYRSGTQCVKQNGEIVPELEMKDHLLQELRLLQSRIPIHQFPFGPNTSVRLCRKFMDEHDHESIARLLDSAGDLRMRRKKERYLESIRSHDFLQAFYEGFMEGMGYKQSRYAFRELAVRVPAAELRSLDLSNRRGIDSMAAVLLGTAGLLEEFAQIRLQHTDPETYHYVGELFQHWHKHAGRFQQRRMTGFCWYPSSTRPANFPARRLTAVAAFLHYHRDSIHQLLLQPVLSCNLSKRGIRSVFKNWIELFGRPLHLYWSYHFQFDHRKFSAPRRLIGRERARILTLNVVIPALLADAEARQDAGLEKALHELYRFHPPLSQNSITRLMEHRLFGDPEKVRELIVNARRQQALHHFFYDFCDNRESSCSRCELAHEHPIEADD